MLWIDQRTLYFIASVAMSSYDDEVQAGMDSGGSEHYIFTYFLIWAE